MADFELRERARALDATPDDLEAFLRHRKALRRSGQLAPPVDVALTALRVAVGHREHAWLCYQRVSNRRPLGSRAAEENRARALWLAAGMRLRRAYRRWLRVADLQVLWEEFVRAHLQGAFNREDFDALWPTGLPSLDMRDVLDARLRPAFRRMRLWQ